MNNVKFEKKISKIGSEYVAVDIIENANEMNLDGIYVPDSFESNARLAFAKVSAIGTKAAEETGVKVGDYVMIDRLSTFGHAAPVATLKYNNIIYTTNATCNSAFPLKDMLFVEPDLHKGDLENVGGIYVQDNPNKLQTGTVVAINSEDKTFSVGDKVILSKGADHVKIGNQEISIYKMDMIVAAFDK